MRIQLPNGKTIEVSYYEFIFLLEDHEVDIFYQQCMADDLGSEINNPFSGKKAEFLDIDEDDFDI